MNLPQPPDPDPFSRKTFHIPRPQTQLHKLGRIGLILSLISFPLGGLLSPISLVISTLAMQVSPRKAAFWGLFLSIVQIIVFSVLWFKGFPSIDVIYQNLG